MVLKRFWFDPVLRVLAAREKRSRSAITSEAPQDDAERMRRDHGRRCRSEGRGAA
jgi:hypothetical protein